MSNLYHCGGIRHVSVISPGAIGLGGRLFSEDDLPPRLTMVNCTGGEPNLQACPSVTGSQEIIRCDSAVVICQCTYLLWLTFRILALYSTFVVGEGGS